MRNVGFHGSFAADAPVVRWTRHRREATTDRLVSAFYWPTVLWVEYPVLTVVPAVLFGAGLRQVRRAGRRSRGLLIATALWGLYAVYEGVMYVWAQGVIAPIRIDLILLGPLMYLVTGIGLVSWWRARLDRPTRAA